MSKLLKQVYPLLSIKSVHTTPYHPQTDWLTEQVNHSLKQMLCKFGNETGSDWDHGLPYREVPQASTGFFFEGSSSLFGGHLRRRSVEGRDH